MSTITPARGGVQTIGSVPGSLTASRPSERLDALVIGGSQAGLAMGYHLRQQGMRFAILDAGARVGDAWRNRYDSLVLFTPAQYNSLPGHPFPGSPDTYPTRDQVANYLEAYARCFDLPVQVNSCVTSVDADSSGDGYAVYTADATYRAANVVVATGGFQRPYVPEFSHELRSDVLQLHSSEYRNPEQLPAGGVLVVGAGNSGAQIAAELAPTRPVYLAAGTRLGSLPQRFLGKDIQWWLRVLGLMRVTADSRLGQRLRHKDSLIGINLRTLERHARVKIVGRAIAAQGDQIRTADGHAVTVRSVIWATGFRPDYGWIHLPVFDASGRPIQQRGVTAVRGLFFLGLAWQHTRGSALLGGVGVDAEHLANRIAVGAATTQSMV